MTRARMARPPNRRRHLSPPPMRRDWPPARRTPATILHVDERPVLLAEHAAMDRAGREVEAGRRVDLLGQGVKPGGLEDGVARQADLGEFFHEVAEDRALGAARGQRLLAQLLLE